MGVVTSAMNFEAQISRGLLFGVCVTCRVLCDFVLNFLLRQIIVLPAYFIIEPDTSRVCFIKNLPAVCTSDLLH